MHQTRDHYDVREPVIATISLSTHFNKTFRPHEINHQLDTSIRKRYLTMHDAKPMMKSYKGPCHSLLQ